MEGSACREEEKSNLSTSKYWFDLPPIHMKIHVGAIMSASEYSRSSCKRTPSGRDKNVRNWSWPLTRIVLVSSH